MVKKILAISLVVLLSSCATIRSVDENFFWHYSLTMITDELESSSYLKNKCAFNLEKPDVLALDHETLNARSKYNFTIKGIYNQEIGMVAYTHGDIDALIHEYHHSIFRDASHACMSEYLARYASRIYTLQDAMLSR